jgi:hypothetical protein
VNGARDVGGAVAIMTARIDQHDIFRANYGRTLVCGMIVNNRAVRSSTQNCVERNPHKSIFLLPELEQLLTGFNFCHSALKQMRQSTRKFVRTKHSREKQQNETFKGSMLSQMRKRVNATAS